MYELVNENHHRSRKGGGGGQIVKAMKAQSEGTTASIGMCSIKGLL